MFEKEYKKEGMYWGEKPTKAVSYALGHIKNGFALDLGSGEGKNSLFLAKEGFNVSAVDISKEGIKKLEKLSKEKNLHIKTFNQNINNFGFDKNYDLIISIATLHFLSELEAKKIIYKMKENTSIRGINVMTVFNEENPSKKFPYLFKKGELKKYYSDWEILSYKEIMTPLEKHGNGSLHRHGITVLVARKLN